MAAEESEDEAGPSGAPPHRDSKAGPAGTASQPTGIHKYGRKLKDKLTSSTHEEREQERRRREELERRQYERHMQFRQAMSKAMQTGQPQFVCKDEKGRDVFVEPPAGYGPGRGYGGGGYGYNPYASGPYTNPNARFIRPPQPYARPYGYGYGGGIGLPLMGGLMGGALLGGALF